MGWYILTFFVGAALGGGGVGWIMWTQMDAIKEKLAKAEAVLGRNL